MAKANGRRLRRWWWIGGIVVVILGVAVALRPRSGPETEKDPIRTAKAEVADVQVRVSEVGSVEPLVKVDVKSVLSGKVVELLVREGDSVRKGQTLARVEPDVNQARDLSQVKNALETTDIALSEAKANYERDRGLLEQGLLSPKAGLESETRFRTAQSVHDAAREKYRIVEESGVPIAIAGADSTQRLNVTSPMDGVVIRRGVELGDTVTSGVSSFNGGTVLMTVADVETMIIEAGVNEVDIGKLRLGQPVKMTLDAYPKVKFAGTIDRIAPAARLEDKVKVFDVEIGIDRQGTELRTGMTANIDILGEKREAVLTVPVEAVFRRDDKEVVYVPKPPQDAAKKSADAKGLVATAHAASSPAPTTATKLDDKDKWKERFELREVETGLQSVDRVQILNGLAAGSEVALEDPSRPREKKRD